jgi:hypothetical protein
MRRVNYYNSGGSRTTAAGDGDAGCPVLWRGRCNGLFWWLNINVGRAAGGGVPPLHAYI